jgi:hypothetical protein
MCGVDGVFWESEIDLETDVRQSSGLDKFQIPRESKSQFAGSRLFVMFVGADGISDLVSLRV